MAEITATKQQGGKSFVWENVTSSDTITERLLEGGDWTIEVIGTFDGATVQMQYGSSSSDMYNTDTNAAPDGHKFTAPRASNAFASRGFWKPVITGGGASQDVTIRMSKI